MARRPSGERRLWSFQSLRSEFRQNEPDDFCDSQDAGAISLDGWPLGSAGQWNDVDELNALYYLVEFATVAGEGADFDNDGDVDGDDFLAWQAAFGCSGDCPVDADGDDDTDGVDFLAWQAEFGSGVASAASSAAVPEPGAWLLLLAGLATVILPRRRFTRR